REAKGGQEGRQLGLNRRIGGGVECHRLAVRNDLPSVRRAVYYSEGERGVHQNGTSSFSSAFPVSSSPAPPSSSLSASAGSTPDGVPSPTTRKAVTRLNCVPSSWDRSATLTSATMPIGGACRSCWGVRIRNLARSRFVAGNAFGV